MPAKSQAQRGLIFGKRNQYGSKAKTPDKWKWIWDEDWENEGKLPKKKKKNETVQNVVMEADTGFEETTTGSKYIDQVFDDLVYDYGPFGSDDLCDKYREVIYNCFVEEINPSDCADKIRNIHNKTNESYSGNFRAKTVNEMFEEDIYGDPYVSDDTRQKQKEEDEGWTLKPGDEVIFRLKGMGPEFEDADEGDIIKYDGKTAIIDSYETASEIGDKDYEYYNIWFPGTGPGQGEMFYGVSGYHLDEI
jgi:hypothetical protein